MTFLFLLLAACAPPGVLPPPVSFKPGHMGLGVSAGESLGQLGYLGYVGQDYDDPTATTSVAIHFERTTKRRRTLAFWANGALAVAPTERYPITNPPAISAGVVGRTQLRGDEDFRWALEGGGGLGAFWLGVPMTTEVGAKGTLFTAPSLCLGIRETVRIPLGYAHELRRGGLWHLQLSAGAGWAESYNIKSWEELPYQVSLCGGWVWQLSPGRG